MQADEIRELSDDEIRSRIAELEEERFRLKFRSATEALEAPLRFRTIRREVARLKTILRERELALVRGMPGEGGRGSTKRSAAVAGTNEPGTGRKARGKRVATRRKGPAGAG
jgi:large subunit ribosomal protein L29